MREKLQGMLLGNVAGICCSGRLFALHCTRFVFLSAAV